MTHAYLFSFFFIVATFCFPSIYAQSTSQTKVIEVPAEYQTVTKKQLVEKGGFTDWVEVVCEPEVTQTDIQKVQIALKDLGYDVDVQEENAIIDVKTKKALVQFQKDYGVPICCTYSCIPEYLFKAHTKYLESQTSQTDIQKVQTALKDLGYDVNVQEENAIIDVKTKKALVQFQKDYGVPLCMGCTQDYLFKAHKKHLENQ